MSSHSPSERPAGDNVADSALAALASAETRLRMVRHAAGDQERRELAHVLAAAVAHEINNILTPVRAYAEHALSNLGDRECVRNALERAADGAERAARAAEAILESAKPAEMSACASISVAAAAAVRMMGDLAPGDAVATELEGGDRVSIGQAALEQVLLNLLLNARAASRRGQLRAAVRTYSTWNTPTIRIDVEDAGCGIPAERLQRIFDGVDPSGRRRGSGLGLLITRHLVEAAGGTIQAHSIEGGGTRFCIELPSAVGSRVEAA